MCFCLVCIESAGAADVVGSFVNVSRWRIICFDDFVFHIWRQNCLYCILHFVQLYYCMIDRVQAQCMLWQLFHLSVRLSSVHHARKLYQNG